MKHIPTGHKRSGGITQIRCAGLQNVTGAYSGLHRQYWTRPIFSYPAPVHMLGGIHAYSIILFEQESGGSNMGKTVLYLQL